jgi:hypothetical protein
VLPVRGFASRLASSPVVILNEAKDLSEMIFVDEAWSFRYARHLTMLIGFRVITISRF